MINENPSVGPRIDVDTYKINIAIACINTKLYLCLCNDR